MAPISMPTSPAMHTTCPWPAFTCWKRSSRRAPVPAPGRRAASTRVRRPPQTGSAARASARLQRPGGALLAWASECAQLPHLKIAGHERVRRLADDHTARWREVLHPGSQGGGVAHRRIVQAQVGLQPTDPSGPYAAPVSAVSPTPTARPALRDHPQALAQSKRRMHRTLGMILLRAPVRQTAPARCLPGRAGGSPGSVRLPPGGASQTSVAPGATPQPPGVSPPGRLGECTNQHGHHFMLR